MNKWNDKKLWKDSKIWRDFNKSIGIIVWGTIFIISFMIFIIYIFTN
jgi:hypothetical protein